MTVCLTAKHDVKHRMQKRLRKKRARSWFKSAMFAATSVASGDSVMLQDAATRVWGFDCVLDNRLAPFFCFVVTTTICTSSDMQLMPCSAAASTTSQYRHHASISEATLSISEATLALQTVPSWQHPSVLGTQPPGHLHPPGQRFCRQLSPYHR